MIFGRNRSNVSTRFGEIRKHTPFGEHTPNLYVRRNENVSINVYRYKYGGSRQALSNNYFAFGNWRRCSRWWVPGILMKTYFSIRTIDHWHDWLPFFGVCVCLYIISLLLKSADHSCSLLRSPPITCRVLILLLWSDRPTADDMVCRRLIFKLVMC